MTIIHDSCVVGKDPIQGILNFFYTFNKLVTKLCHSNNKLHKITPRILGKKPAVESCNNIPCQIGYFFCKKHILSQLLSVLKAKH